MQIADLVETLHVHHSYLYKLETGHSRRCSAAFYAQLVDALGLSDYRVLLACPYGDGAHPSSVGDPAEHDGRWTPDSAADTESLERPETGGYPPTGEDELTAVGAGSRPAVPAQRGGRHRRGSRS